MDLDDDYSFTEDQRQAMHELNTIQYGNYYETRKHSFRVIDSDDHDYLDLREHLYGSYSASARLREINDRLRADKTPIEMDRHRRVNFKERLVEYKELSSDDSLDDGYGDSPDGLYEDDKEELERYDDLEVDHSPVGSSKTNSGALQLEMREDNLLVKHSVESAVGREPRGESPRQVSESGHTWTSESDGGEVKGQIIDSISNCTRDISLDSDDNEGKREDSILGVYLDQVKTTSSSGGIWGDASDEEENNSRGDRPRPTWSAQPDEEKVRDQTDSPHPTWSAQPEEEKVRGQPDSPRLTWDTQSEEVDGHTADPLSKPGFESDEDSSCSGSDNSSSDADRAINEDYQSGQPNGRDLQSPSSSSSELEKSDGMVDEEEREFVAAKERTKRYCYVYQEPEEFEDLLIDRRTIIPPAPTPECLEKSPSNHLKLDKSDSKQKALKNVKKTSDRDVAVTSQSGVKPSRLTFSKSYPMGPLPPTPKLNPIRAGRRILTRAPGMKPHQPHNCVMASSPKSCVPEVRPLRRERIPEIKLRAGGGNRPVPPPQGRSYELVECEDLQETSPPLLINTPASTLPPKQIKDGASRPESKSVPKSPPRNIFSATTMSENKGKVQFSSQKKSISLNQLPTHSSDFEGSTNSQDLKILRSTMLGSKREEEAQLSFKLWLDKKNEQSRIEKRMLEIKRQKELAASGRPNREECDRAFREWLAQKKMRKQVPTTGMLRNRRNGSLERNRSTWTNIKRTLNVYLAPM